MGRKEQRITTQVRGLCWALFVVAAVLMGGTAYDALASKVDLKDSFKFVDAKADHPVYLTLGTAELLTVDGPVSDVLVANPSIVSVSALQSNRLYLVGLNVGDTNLIAIDAQGNIVKRINIHVKYDLKAIQATIDELFPNETVNIRAVHDQIFLTGKVSTPEKASKIANLVGHYVSDLQDQEGETDQLVSNLLEVRGEQQVMLQVRILEASRSVLKELGVRTNANDTTGAESPTVFGLSPFQSNFGGQVNTSEFNALALGAGDAITLSRDPAATGAALFDSRLNGIGQIGIFVDALEDQDLVNILAEPNLTAVSGQQAGFLAGGEFPIPVGRDQVGNIVIEFRQFGVSLNFRPVVLSEDRINLQLNTEVSSLDFESSIVLADLTVPGLDVRRADTTVEVPSGGSLMIAGLLQSEAIKGMTGLPGISDTPVLGDLVKSNSFQRNETELVVIVTPYIVKPYEQTERAEKEPVSRTNPLARMFYANINKFFNIDSITQVFAGDEMYGYLLD